jgi:sulfatase modifying factor 1
MPILDSIAAQQWRVAILPGFANDWNHSHNLGCGQLGAIARSLALLVVLGWLSGCGGSKPPTAPQTKIIPPVTVAAPQPPPSAPKPKGDGAGKPAKAEPKVVTVPPGTDPNSLFDVETVGDTVVIDPNSTVATDVVTIESAQPGIDSTRLVVASVEPVSKGRPKSGFSLPTGFVPLPDEGYSDEGMPLRIRCEKTGSVLALVPAGVVRIGTNSGPAESQPELTLHIDTYYMELFEVTVEQFEAYRQEMKDKKKPVPTTMNATAPPRTPVLGVAWGNAQAYARWAGMDLPTEAEFEKGTRGPSSLRTPWGDGRAIWPSNRTPETLTPVGSYTSDRSPFGIYDLAGNAREWCGDLYSERAHRDALGTSGQVPHNWSGPKKVSNGNLRVVKGNGSDWSAWHRQGRDIGKGFADVGFRCVLRIITPEPKSGT